MLAAGRCWKSRILEQNMFWEHSLLPSFVNLFPFADLSLLAWSWLSLVSSTSQFLPCVLDSGDCLASLGLFHSSLSFVFTLLYSLAKLFPQCLQPTATIAFYYLWVFCSSIIENVHDAPFRQLILILEACYNLHYRNVKLFSALADYVSSTACLWDKKQVSLNNLQWY